MVPRGLAWDSEHFMSLLPLPRPHARLSLQETHLSKWLTNRRGGDVAALGCVTIPCANLIWIMRIFLSVRSDGFTLNFYLWHRNIKMCVPSLSDGRIIGGIDDQAFRSKLIRPDLLTNFWTLKSVMSDKKSISHIHLDQEHYRNNSATKVSSKYLQTFWRIWIKYPLNWNSFWDCVGRSEDCEVEEVFFSVQFPVFKSYSMCC